MSPKPRSGESKDDFISRCMGDSEAKQDFPDQDQRLAFCHSVYKQKHGGNVLAMTASQMNATELRTVQLHGRDHLVVPAVLVQDQVLHNNLGATLLPATEITDDWAEEWNGVPVIIHDHPSKRGVPVSARDPEIWDKRGVGHVYHAHVTTNGATQLKAEVWLDLARADQVKELQSIVERLYNGEAVELSTGFLSMTEEATGAHNGEAYDKILHPKGADHLAIFVDKIGACSLKDGCGLGVHEMIPLEACNVRSTARRPKYSGTSEKSWKRPTLADFEDADASWDDLPATRKSAIVASTLLGEVEDTFAASMVFPVVEPGGALNRHALNAVRSIAHGGRGGAKIPKAAADSAYKMAGTLLKDEFDVDISDNVDAGSEDETQRGRVLGLVDRLMGFLVGERKSEAQNVDESDEERRQAVVAALEENFGGQHKMLWVDAMYSDKHEVVFGVITEELEGRREQLYRAQFTVKDGGDKDVANKITFSEPEPVVRRIVYEAAGNQGSIESQHNQESDLMNDPKKAEGQEPTAGAAAAQNASAAAPPPEPEKKEEPGKKEEPTQNQAAGEPKAEPAAQAEPKKDAICVETMATQLAELKSLIESQKEEINALRAATAPAVAEKERERQALVDELAANQEVPFDKAELEAKPVDELRKLRAMSRGEHYAARGGPHVAENKASEPAYMPTVPYWQKADNQEKKKEDGE